MATAAWSGAHLRAMLLALLAAVLPMGGGLAEAGIVLAEVHGVSSWGSAAKQGGSDGAVTTPCGTAQT